MTGLYFVFITALLIAAAYIYFKIADHYGIIDKPNHRSSHLHVTIRGGGIVFPIAMIMYPIFFGNNYGYFLCGMLIISVISFIDDIRPVSNRIRILFHIIAVILLFLQMNTFDFPWYVIAISLFVIIGIINAVNFMDGINGITGTYCLVTLLSLLFINRVMDTYIDSSFIVLPAIALLVFNFFNFRKNARCFAGDVGSVSIAYLIVFLMGILIFKTHNPSYLLLLLIYGLDAVTTIFFRFLRKENIFEAHRSHYYQFLANEKGFPQLQVSLGYALIQGAVNVLLVTFLIGSFLYSAIFTLFLAGGFITLRIRTEGKKLYTG